ncbi:hypothetical protein [Dactylosporangium sp. CA-139066]|uniref:hypothetical protein n=1 Tax=Dactylosporangium sp. CA-139066 TaxID=3239930 RepID=UPI003D8E2DCF
MPDTIVEDEFARFAEEYTGSFRPVPVEAMPRWRRARRRGALWAGGLLAALVAALTANALQPAAPGPADQVTERTVRLAGARGTMSLDFTDAAHGWVMFSDCPAGQRCAVTLGRTTDGGRSWERIATPDLPEGQPAGMIVTGAKSALVGTMTDPRWFETDDGGRSFRAVTSDQAQAIIDAYVARRFVPGPAPSGETVVPGAYPQRWKVVHEGLTTRVSYSPDGGTWRELPAELPAGAELKVSGDGRDAWLVAEMPNRLWRLTPGDAVEVPDFPPGTPIRAAQAIGGDGLLITVPGEGAGVWREGRFTPFPGPMARALGGLVLGDGTLSLYLQQEGVILGREGGSWTWYRPPPA